MKSQWQKNHQISTLWVTNSILICHEFFLCQKFREIKIYTYLLICSWTLRSFLMYRYPMQLGIKPKTISEARKGLSRPLKSLLISWFEGSRVEFLSNIWGSEIFLKETKSNKFLPCFSKYNLQFGELRSQQPIFTKLKLINNSMFQKFIRIEIFDPWILYKVWWFFRTVI